MTILIEILKEKKLGKRASLPRLSVWLREHKPWGGSPEKNPDRGGQPEAVDDGEGDPP
jgi:hypothetical protein